MKAIKQGYKELALGVLRQAIRDLDSTKYAKSKNVSFEKRAVDSWEFFFNHYYELWIDLSGVDEHNLLASIIPLAEKSRRAGVPIPKSQIEAVKGYTQELLQKQ